MRVRAIFCDRCNGRIWDERPGGAYDLSMVGQVSVAQGDRRATRDLCPGCLALVERAMLPVPAGAAPGKMSGVEVRGEDASARLAEARLVANRAIEAWADGAPPDSLIKALRDVSSAAKR